MPGGALSVVVACYRDRVFFFRLRDSGERFAVRLAAFASKDQKVHYPRYAAVRFVGQRYEVAGYELPSDVSKV
jgi:hypothetical protein